MIQKKTSPIDGPIEVDCRIRRHPAKSFEPEPYNLIKAIKSYMDKIKKVKIRNHLMEIFCFQKKYYASIIQVHLIQQRSNTILKYNKDLWL